MENHHFLWVNQLFLWPFSSSQAGKSVYRAGYFRVALSLLSWKSFFTVRINHNIIPSFEVLGSTKSFPSWSQPGFPGVKPMIWGLGSSVDFTQTSKKLRNSTGDSDHHRPVEIAWRLGFPKQKNTVPGSSSGWFDAKTYQKNCKLTQWMFVKRIKNQPVRMIMFREIPSGKLT